MKQWFGSARPVLLAFIFNSLLLVIPNSAGAQGHYSPVTEDNVVDLKLDHYFSTDEKPRAQDFDWTFTRTGFVLKRGNGPIPASLQGLLLPEGITADEIRGRWKLATDNGQRLVLTAIMAGSAPGKRNVSLNIYKTAPTVVRIGDPQFVFALQNSSTKTKTGIEYRWMENYFIKGITEERETHASENVNQHWYLHIKPVESTQEANAKLMNNLENGDEKWLAVIVDGQHRESLVIAKSTIARYPDIFNVSSSANAEDERTR